jgi:DNA-binding NarL/FixJ family response regulator
MTPDSIRIALVSPVAALRAGWRAFLNVDSAIEIVAESTSLNLLEQTECQVDVVVVTSDSTDSAQINHFTQPASPTAILLLVTDETEAIRAFSGSFEKLAFGVLSVNLAAEDMIAAVHALYQGLVIGSPHLIKQILGQSDLSRNNHQGKDMDPLTQRETLVLQLLAQGLTNKQIALKLVISEHTVKFHIQSIYSKMRVNNRAEVVRVGVTTGLIIV